MRPRGLLIANPNATTTSARTRDVITGALTHEIDLDVVTTTHRGHAQELAAQARRDGVDLLLTLGGDGTINEAVNGLLAAGTGEGLPILATIPGGAANVLARALGFPNEAIEATGMILESLRTRTSHDIGLGHARFTPLPDDEATPDDVSTDTDDDADDEGTDHTEPDGAEDGGVAGLEAPPGVERTHWFTINAGIGLDADVISAMEAQRAQGHSASGGRYLWTALQEYLRDPERKEPTLRIERPGVEPITGIALAIVQNTAPWTYLGPVPINPCPQASFDLGLDVFAPHSLGLLSTARYGARMLRGSRLGAVPGGLTLLHDQPELTIRAGNATNLQLDGDSMGRVRSVVFTSVPHALRIAG